MNRKETLHNAEICVCGQREEDYGSPEDNFATIALLWGVYLRAAHPELKKVMEINHITAIDVAVMMNQLKVARIATGKAKADNYIDGCGYLACAAEIATGGIKISEIPSEPQGEYRVDEVVAENTFKSFCKKTLSCIVCQIGKNSDVEQISCRQWVKHNPHEALDIMRKVVE